MTLLREYTGGNMKYYTNLGRIVMVIGFFAIAIRIIYHDPYVPILSEGFTALFITVGLLGIVDLAIRLNREE
jgi:hypothetical protein